MSELFDIPYGAAQGNQQRIVCPTIQCRADRIGAAWHNVEVVVRGIVYQREVLAHSKANAELALKEWATQRPYDPEANEEED